MSSIEMTARAIVESLEDNGDIELLSSEDCAEELGQLMLDELDDAPLSTLNVERVSPRIAKYLLLSESVEEVYLDDDELISSIRTVLSESLAEDD